MEWQTEQDRQHAEEHVQQAEHEMQVQFMQRMQEMQEGLANATQHNSDLSVQLANQQALTAAATSERDELSERGS